MKLSIIQNKPLIQLASVGVMTLMFLSVANSQEDLTGIKCVVNGKKAAKAESSAEYKGGKVYFCCDHCVESFEEDLKLKSDAKYKVKANHQLVLTGQYVQKGCPMSGSPVKKGLVAKVGGTKVGFCCEGCMNKVENTENLEAKSKLVFTEKAFKNAFEKKKSEVNLDEVKCILMPKKNVIAGKFVEYKEGKVYFCCGGCVKKFNADVEKFTTQANHQLVATGQFVQTGCPISGGDVDDDQMSVVGGVEVRFCCDKCKAKVDGASTDEAKAELVFGKKRFEKAFARR